MRNTTITRKTKETDIKLSLVLDGCGNIKVKTGVDFFDHMLISFATHAGFDLELECKGDVNVDCHHTIEDVGIVLGDAYQKALGDKVGIERFASVYMPMDESLTRCAVDISGRSFLVFKCEFFRQFVGQMETSMVEEFLRAFATNAKITLHIENLYGTNDHHKTESIFKALARCLKLASKITSNQTPSSKGSI